MAAHAPGADLQRHAAGPELERARGLERDPPGDTLRKHQARHRGAADGCHCGIPAHRTRRRPGDECSVNHPTGQLPTPGDSQHRRFERSGQHPPFFGHQLLRLRLPHHRRLRGHQPDAPTVTNGECGHQRRRTALPRCRDGGADRPLRKQPRSANQRPVDQQKCSHRIGF